MPSSAAAQRRWRRRKANRAALARSRSRSRRTAPRRTATWSSPIKTDPFTIPIADKVALLLAANEAALKVRGVRFVTSGVNFLREEKTFANTDGSLHGADDLPLLAEREHHRRVGGQLRLPDARRERDGAARARLRVRPEREARENAPKWAEEAVQKLSAKPVEVGRYDLILHPIAPLAHDPRVDRAPHRARSRARLRGELRRHELRRAAGKGARHSSSTVRSC